MDLGDILKWVCLGTVGVIILAIVSAFSRWSGDNAQPSAVKCPRCKTRVGLALITCGNCQSTGGIKRNVLRVYGVPRTYFECRVCKRNLAAIRCECGTDVSGLMSR